MARKLTISVLVILTKIVNAGNVLFYIPYGPLSSCITMVPIANELVTKGHSVTMVTGFDNLSAGHGVAHIVINSTFEKYHQKMCRPSWGEDRAKSVSPVDIANLCFSAIDTNRNAMANLRGTS